MTITRPHSLALPALEPLAPADRRAPAESNGGECASSCAGACRASHAPEERDIMRFRSGTLHENWYVAALSRQVTGKRPFAATVMEEPIVLFRDDRGRPTALVDRCLHRNAALSKGDV